jgi:hypothetical protein
MLGRRRGDFNPRRFWSWFSGEAQGLANAIEALSRGESDAEWQMIALNERIRRYDPDLEADIVRSLDGTCHLTVSGGSDHSIAALLHAAPRTFGWRFTTRAGLSDQRRVPFRVAPRPSMDDHSPVESAYEAWAV